MIVYTLQEIDYDDEYNTESAYLLIISDSLDKIYDKINKHYEKVKKPDRLPVFTWEDDSKKMRENSRWLLIDKWEVI